MTAQVLAESYLKKGQQDYALGQPKSESWNYVSWLLQTVICSKALVLYIPTHSVISNPLIYLLQMSQISTNSIQIPLEERTHAADRKPFIWWRNLSLLLEICVACKCDEGESICISFVLNSRLWTNTDHAELLLPPLEIYHHVSSFQVSSQLPLRVVTCCLQSLLQSITIMWKLSCWCPMSVWHRWILQATDESSWSITSQAPAGRSAAELAHLISFWTWKSEMKCPLSWQEENWRIQTLMKCTPHLVVSCYIHPPPSDNLIPNAETLRRDIQCKWIWSVNIYHLGICTYCEWMYNICCTSWYVHYIRNDFCLSADYFLNIPYKCNFVHCSDFLYIFFILFFITEMFLCVF